MTAAAYSAAWRLERIEDIEWMAGTGETVPGAAARLHIHPHSLRRELERAGRLDLFRKLLANHGDHGQPPGFIPPVRRRGGAAA